MDAGQVESFRDLLIREQARLKDEIARLSTVTVAGDNLGYGNHMADDATEAFDQAAGLALRRNLEATLEKIQDALRRFRAAHAGCEFVRCLIEQDIHIALCDTENDFFGDGIGMRRALEHLL